MKRIAFYVIMIAMSFSACKKYSKYEGVPFTEKEPRDWENPGIFNINREEIHASLFSFQDEQSALEDVKANSANYISLDGVWKFNLAKSPEQRPFWFFKDDYDIRDWESIEVPSNWQMKGFDVPLVETPGYPTKNKLSLIGRDLNSVGSYKRSFTVTSDWNDKEVFLQFGAVSSAFYVWVNEQFVGYCEDSKIPAEFKITSFLKKGKNTISVEVYRWSDGSYLEDQDFWRLSGIQRGVFLQARPKTFIEDYFVVGDLENNYSDGKLKLNLELKSVDSTISKASLMASLYDGVNKIYTDSYPVDISKGKGSLTFEQKIPSVKNWSAEKPNLYSLVLTLYDADGKILESLNTKVGFRRVEIVDSQLLVNGVAIKMKGVSLHEHSDINGHVIDEATLLKDIRLMKSNNINAVRTSNYPHQEVWYDLCDKYGLYIIDEADIESHITGSDTKDLIINNPEWENGIVDRIKSMVERDKNHASVITWSMGNISGKGQTFLNGLKWIKGRDITRPVQLYMTLQDDFTWDWVDQGLLKTNEDGEKYWTYAEDSAEDVIPASLSINGLVWPDRKAKPNLAEVKKVYQYIEFEPFDLINGMVRFVNNYDFTNLSDFIFEWEVVSDGLTLSSGSIPGLNIKPGNSPLVQIPFRKIKPAPGSEYFLNIRASRGDEWNYVPEGHVFASAQFKLPVEGTPVSGIIDELAMLQTKTVDKKIEVSGTDMMLVFNLENGRMESFSYKGKELVKKGPEPDFWRAPTENDYALEFNKSLGVWKKAGERTLVTGANIGQPAPGKVVLTFTYDIQGIDGKKIAGYASSYTVLASGDILIKNQFSKISAIIPEIPRIGMQMQLPEEFLNLKWFGRGPHENYADRNTSAYVGLYESTVADQYTPYIRPRENGYRTDIRWLTLTDEDGTGILVSGNPLFCFSALNNTHDDFESQENLLAGTDDKIPVNSHTADIKPRDIINLNIDLGQMGLGGENSGSTSVPTQYRFTGMKYEYSFRIRPVVKEDDILKLAKEKF